MPDQLQLRGGTTAQHATFTGASKEVTVDTTKKTAVIHDGATAGGNPLLREDGSNSALSLGSAGTPTLKFTGDTNTGLYSPGADQVSVATGGAERLRVDSTGQIEAVNLGTAAAPVYSFTTDPNTGVYSPGADQIALTTGGTGRLFADASGNVGVGATPSTTTRLEVSRLGGAWTGPAQQSGVALTLHPGGGGSGSAAQIQMFGGNTSSNFIFFGDTDQNNIGYIQYDHSADALIFVTNSGERVRFTSTGRVGINTSSPDARLTVNGQASFDVGSAGAPAITFISDLDTGIFSPGANTVAISTTGTERFRVNSDGRLLSGGTSSSIQVPISSSTLGDPVCQLTGTLNPNGAAALYTFNAAVTIAPSLILAKSRGATVGAQTIVNDGDALGRVVFQGSDGQAVGTNAGFIRAAVIEGQVDGTPGAGDMPGRLVLSTTADGTNSPTEAFRITNDRVRCYNQAAPVAVDTTATLTVGNLKTGIITSSTAAAVTMTLPTGTDTQAGFSGTYDNMTFEWSVINTGATNAVTIAAGTGHTIVGSATIAASNSGRFATRRTAANTFVTYRLSS
jgi:hypothetical protein